MRRVAVAVCAMVAVASFACNEAPYLRTNPYDPNVPVGIVIAGPDSLVSLGQLGVYRAQATPAFPDSAFTWTVDTVTVFNGARDTVVDGAHYLKPTGLGGFEFIAVPLAPATVTIAIGASLGAVDTVVMRSINGAYVLVKTKAYRHSAYKQVVLTQVVTRIQLRCPDIHGCDTISAGGTWSVWADGFDALGHLLYALTSATANPAAGAPLATFVSRDTTVASVAPVGIRAATVTARRAGATWLVASRGTLLDSLRLVVQ